MKKFIGVLCCAIIVLSGLVSCGKTEEPVVKNDTKPTETTSEPKNVEMEESQNYTFENGVLTMAVPKGWQTDVDTYKEYRSYYSSDTSPKKEYVKNLSVNSDPFKNDSKKGEYADDGVVLSFGNIIDLGREENANLYPVFNENKFKKIGKYYVYIDDNLENSMRKGAVYIDKTTILPMFFEHIPTKGLTPELESMFSSFKVMR